MTVRTARAERAVVRGAPEGRRGADLSGRRQLREKRPRAGPVIDVLIEGAPVALAGHEAPHDGIRRRTPRVRHALRVARVHGRRGFLASVSAQELVTHWRG